MQEKRITVQDVKQNEKLAVLIDAANRMLEVIGYTEHGPRHVGFVSHTARSILSSSTIRSACASWPPSPAGSTTWATPSTA